MRIAAAIIETLWGVTVPVDQLALIVGGLGQLAIETVTRMAR